MRRISKIPATADPASIRVLLEDGFGDGGDGGGGGGGTTWWHLLSCLSHE